MNHFWVQKKKTNKLVWAPIQKSIMKNERLGLNFKCVKFIDFKEMVQIFVFSCKEMILQDMNIYKFNLEN